MNIFIGSDHAGYELKNFLSKALGSIGYRVVDCGAYTYQPSDDYPLYISKVARAVSESEAIKSLDEEMVTELPEFSDSQSNETRGIVIGGSGQGEAIVANKFSNVRAALCYGGDQAEDIVELSRQHNDSNVLSLGARFLSNDLALELVLKWLSTPFSGDQRHIRRIHEIDKLQDNHQLYE